MGCYGMSFFWAIWRKKTKDIKSVLYVEPIIAGPTWLYFKISELRYTFVIYNGTHWSELPDFLCPLVPCQPKKWSIDSSCRLGERWGWRWSKRWSGYTGERVPSDPHKKHYDITRCINHNWLNHHVLETVLKLVQCTELDILESGLSTATRYLKYILGFQMIAPVQVKQYCFTCTGAIIWHLRMYYRMLAVVVMLCAMYHHNGSSYNESQLIYVVSSLNMKSSS